MSHDLVMWSGKLSCDHPKLPLFKNVDYLSACEKSSMKVMSSGREFWYDGLFWFLLPNLKGRFLNYLLWIKLTCILDSQLYACYHGNFIHQWYMDCFECGFRLLLSDVSKRPYNWQVSKEYDQLYIDFVKATSRLFSCCHIVTVWQRGKKGLVPLFSKLVANRNEVPNQSVHYTH